MKRIKLSKLPLRHETIRQLSNQDLSKVAGAAPRTDSSDCLTPGCPIIEPIPTFQCPSVFCPTAWCPAK